jgi:hypothetical protein
LGIGFGISFEVLNIGEQIKLVCRMLNRRVYNALDGLKTNMELVMVGVMGRGVARAAGHGLQQGSAKPLPR